MDGSAFRNLDFKGLGLLLFFAAVGVISTMVGAAVIVGWIVRHLQWVS